MDVCSNNSLLCQACTICLVKEIAQELFHNRTTQKVITQSTRVTNINEITTLIKSAITIKSEIYGIHK